MHEHDADSLQLTAGQPVCLLRQGAALPLTKDALTDAQIAALVREIAPPGALPRLTDPTESLTFEYTGAGARVHVAVTPGPQGVGALLSRAAPVTGHNDSARREAVEGLFRLLVETGASDLHLRAGEPPVLRHSGELVRHDGPPLPAEQLEAMLATVMGPRETAEYRESGDTDWAYELPDVARFRCNAGRDRLGPFAVVRVIPTSLPTVTELGLSREIQNLCYLTKGLVVVTGPTGSGKSTTLAAMIDLINRARAEHILTIEDPIEFVHQSRKCVVTQRQVGLHTRTFKGALRAALREDPDVLLVGEMRDLETISIAIETAETGHLVFGTLHTTTAPSTVDRIIDQFPADRQAQIRVMLSESLRGVVSQTLCRKIGGGRVAAREVLLSVPAISNLIREGKTFQIPSIMQTQRKTGMVTLNDALMELVDAKLVEPKEAYLRAVEKSGFLAALKAKRHDVGFLDEV